MVWNKQLVRDLSFALLADEDRFRILALARSVLKI